MFRAWLRFGTEISMVLGPMACHGSGGGEAVWGGFSEAQQASIESHRVSFDGTGNKTTRNGSGAPCPAPLWEIPLP